MPSIPLEPINNLNTTASSTYWLRNGAFLKLKMPKLVIMYKAGVSM